MGTDMRAQLGAMLDEYRQSRSRIDSLSAELAAMTETVRSTDRSITAVVGSQGQLVSLHLDPVAASRLDLETLAARIVEAAGIGNGRIQARLQAGFRELLPSHLRDVVCPDGTVDVSRLLPGAAADLAWRTGGSR